MKLEINPRENGACPLCKNNGRCPLQDRLKESMKNIEQEHEMEIVIYSCPHFKEKF